MRPVNLDLLYRQGYDYMDLTGEPLGLADCLCGVVGGLPFDGGVAADTSGLTGSERGKPDCIAYERFSDAPAEAQMFWRYIQNSGVLNPYRSDFSCLEISFARYAVGHGVSPHNDLAGSVRSLNLALYLSREWSGGDLRFTQGGRQRGLVVPVYGRLVIILNDSDFLHEVTPTNVIRYAALCRFH